MVYCDVIILGLSFSPTVAYGWDIAGWSYDLTINEGRQFVSLGVRADYQNVYAQLSYEPTWGGVYNPTRERSFWRRTSWR